MANKVQHENLKMTSYLKSGSLKIVAIEKRTKERGFPFDGTELSVLYPLTVTTPCFMAVYADVDSVKEFNC